MGVFSTCSPIRPNPIGMSVVEVLGIRGTNIDVRGLDMLDSTPILDIKPHIEVTAGKIVSRSDLGPRGAPRESAQREQFQ